jgi:hypothetical protein
MGDLKGTMGGSDHTLPETAEQGEDTAKKALGPNGRLRQETAKPLLEYPELELSNNLAGNSMGPMALGRKNWLHIGSPQAGPKVAAILSGGKLSSGSPISRFSAFQTAWVAKHS